ncbi:MAG: alpha/beta hydrolase [Pseudomonadota bacterium]
MPHKKEYVERRGVGQNVRKESADSNPRRGFGVFLLMRTRQLFLLALLVPVLAKPANTVETRRVEEIEFTSRDARLAGSIVFPKAAKIHSAVVFVHGSGEQTRNMLLAERFASEGIVALVYDKRGVGKSGGKYESDQSVSEKNISVLADDAVSALKLLANHPSLKGVPIGIAGISQAGWIAPLAAERSGLAKFIVLWGGPVCKVSEEDIFSKYTADVGGQTVPSYREALDSRNEKYVWPDFLGRDTDSREDLDRLSIPGLWIFSDNDASIPVDLSISGLQTLRKTGHTFDYVLFSGLGHNNMERTFAVATNWIKQLSK